MEARPPSAGYRLRKFVSRHKGQVLAASVVFLTLIGGIVGTSIGMVEARQAWTAESERAEGERLAKLDAQDKEQLAVAAAAKEKAARLEEERQRKFAEAISRFVKDDFLALTSIEGQDRFGGEGKEGLDKNTTLRQLRATPRTAKPNKHKTETKAAEKHRNPKHNKSGGKAPQSKT